MFLRLYIWIGRYLSPFIKAYLYRRVRLGKEDAERIHERFGLPSKGRHESSPLVWLHGASVGESLSLLSFIANLQKLYPTVQILVTTGTLTSAHMLQSRLPPGVIHQFIPLDIKPWMERFFDYWRPTLIIITETEIWPVMLSLCKLRNIPIYLINARLTDHTYRRWKEFPRTAKALLSSFTSILAQSKENAERFRALGATGVNTMPNLKFAATPLTYDAQRHQMLFALVSVRPSFIAASTHEGEEQIVIQALCDILKAYPKTLLILVPRHLHRIDDIMTSLRQKNLAFVRYSQKEIPIEETQVFLFDTMGDLGMAYSLSKIVLICGSLVKGIGGHNPIEAAQYGCAVLWGPFMEKTRDICSVLKDNSIEVSKETLSTTVLHLLQHKEEVLERGQRLKKKVDSQKYSLKQLVHLCIPHLGEPVTPLEGGSHDA